MILLMMFARRPYQRLRELGTSNREIYQGLLGMSDADLEMLKQEGII